MQLKTFVLCFAFAICISEISTAAVDKGDNSVGGPSDTGKFNSFCGKFNSISDEDIEAMGKFTYWLPECSNEENEGEGGCPYDPDDLDLSVLTYNMKCFKAACDDKDTGYAGIQKCIDKLAMQQKNVLQFRPDNYKAQMDKSCACNYQDEEQQSSGEGDNAVTVCDYKYAYNCQPLETDGECMNTNAQLEKKKYCDMDDEEKEAMSLAAEELVEFYRIRKLCEPGVKTMLMDEFIVPPRCAEKLATQNELKRACQAECYMKASSDEDHLDLFFKSGDDYDYYSDEPVLSYQNLDSNTFDSECGQEGEGPYEEDGVSYYPRSVFFIGQKAIWTQASYLCYEYKTTSEVPKPLMKSPVTAEALPKEDIKAAYEKCCTKDADYYSSITEMLQGKDEVKCLTDEEVMVDFGFVPSLVRGTMQRYSRQCWEFYSEHEPCGSNVIPIPDNVKCTKTGDEVEQMSLARDKDPSEMIWFLKYIEDKNVLGNALQACAEGAKMGRAVTVLPGVSLGLEAQVYGLNEAELGSQTAATLAYITCGVFSSVHHNNYFDMDSECNPYALDIHTNRKFDC